MIAQVAGTSSVASRLRTRGRRAQGGQSRHYRPASPLQISAGRAQAAPPRGARRLQLAAGKSLPRRASRRPAHAGHFQPAGRRDLDLYKCKSHFAPAGRHSGAPVCLRAAACLSRALPSLPRANGRPVGSIRFGRRPPSTAGRRRPLQVALEVQLPLARLGAPASRQLRARGAVIAQDKALACVQYDKLSQVINVTGHGVSGRPQVRRPRAPTGPRRPGWPV